MTEVKKAPPKKRGVKKGAPRTKKQLEQKNGPYKTVIPYKKLDELCKIQCTGEECAAVLQTDYDTLNRRLKEEGFKGFTEYFKSKAGDGRASLRRRQWKSAQEGNSAMLVWLGKQWLGQHDKRDMNHSGMVVSFNLDYGNE